MKVLIVCEESQRVCIEFRKLGHEAFSLDIQECSGGHPEWHIIADALGFIEHGKTDDIQYFYTQDLLFHHVYKWDLIIAHPPCTYLTVTGNRWFNIERYGQKAEKRIEDRKNAIEFFMKIVNANCDKLAIENPVGVMSTVYRKPDQIIQPYMFGDAFEKKTCLWLKGLPKLEPTNIVDPEKRVEFKSGKTMPKWFTDLTRLPPAERARERSKTFIGFAKAMAAQWGGVKQ